jgi:phospho-N-acetylmuramoyl-pentapeptide-transferase
MNPHLIPIFSFALATFLIWFMIMPYFIVFLIKHKLWKQIREEATIWKAIEFLKLHKEKAWTPTMWWIIILAVVFFMVLASILLQKFWYITNSLLNQKETYLTLFTLFTVWVLWAIDDYMNVRWIWRTKWLSARFKMLWLLIFAWIWAMWFYYKLGWNVVDNVWNFVRALNNPFWTDFEIWIYFIPLFIFIIIASANSVNITDWLDGLAWWLLLFSYSVYAYITYSQWLFLLSTLCVTIMW